MLSKDINNLYSKLTNHERAAMSFKALYSSSDKANQKIIDSVPRVTYSQLDKEYTERCDVLHQIALMWSTEYWKAYCKMIASIGAKHYEPATGDQQQADDLRDLVQIHEGRLVALFLILDALDDSHSVDKGTVLAIADIGIDYSEQMPVDMLTGDAKEYYDNWLEFMVSLLERSPLSASANQYFGTVKL